MDMQDKEFDKVFNSKFANFEVEPSPIAWEGIASELDGKKKKHSLMPYLSIAASLLVLFTLAIVFLPHQGKTAKKQLENNRIALNNNQPGTAINQPVVTDTKTSPTNAKRVAEITDNKTQVNSSSVINKSAPVTSAIDTFQKLEVLKNNTQPQITVVNEHKPEIIQPLSPNKDFELMSKAIKPIKMEMMGMTSGTKPDAPVAKRPGIHNPGGLINAILAKVDKRDDKLIQFTDNDDDDAQTSVTGVNLGLIKIIKESNK
jgi:hypothetical protein